MLCKLVGAGGHEYVVVMNEASIDKVAVSFIILEVFLSRKKINRGHLFQVNVRGNPL